MEEVEMEENMDIRIHETKEEINMEELEESIQMIKIGKAPGDDELTGEMIKCLNENYKKELLDMINQMKIEKMVPKDWTKGIITPL